MKKEHHAEQTFDNVDQAMKQYYYITRKDLPALAPKPTLSDFYTPSEDQKNREIAFVVGGMVLTVFCLEIDIDKKGQINVTGYKEIKILIIYIKIQIHKVVYLFHYHLYIFYHQKETY